MSWKSPFLNPDPLTCIGVGPENIAWAKINDEGSWALLDSGSTINAVTPEFVKASFFGHESLEQSGRWYSENKWVWGIVFLNPWVMSS